MVAKLDPNGVLVYLYTIGSALPNVTEATAIALDKEGNAYVTGSSRISFNLPTTPGAFRTNGCGGFAEHGFVAKVNPAGNGLVYCTCLCGSGEDSPTAIAVDTAGKAYVAGATTSYDFPYQSEPAGGVATESAFLSKLDPTGSPLIFSTYLGGTTETIIHDLTLDKDGNVYVSNWRHGRGATFPRQQESCRVAAHRLCVITGAFVRDAFVTKLNSEGGLICSTVLGGEGNDEARGVAVDKDGNT